MESKRKRTITEVLDCETGECIDANDFFQKPLDELTIYRSKLQKAIQGIREALFICYYCKQKIRIRGGISVPHRRKVEIFHFAHLKDSDECHIKTKNHFTREEVDRIKYNGAKESVLHQTLKTSIVECLRKNQETKNEVTSIEVEKVIKNKVAKEWKKPDINAFFNEKRLAIELQLSTTWLDVITKRQHFYKEQGIYIFWIFHTFNSNDDVRKLTYNDVIYTNNQNAYIFDKETNDLSISENDLVLKCYYKTYYRDEQTLSDKWVHSFIKLSDLTFDEKRMRIFYHDAEAQKKKIEHEIEDYISELRETARLKIIQEQEQERRQQEIDSKIEDLNNNIKEINETKTDTEQKQSKTNRKLYLLKEFVSKIDEYSDKTLKYFSDLNFGKPFFEYDEFLKILKEEFSHELHVITQTIGNSNQELLALTKSLSGIANLRTIEISGKLYSSINSSIDWNFIKRNFSQIKTIDKNAVHDLFAEDEMKPIKNEYDLSRLQFSKDIFFLTDFSSKVVELNIQKKTLEETIEKQQLLIVAIQEKIKKKLEIYFQMEISEVENKLNGYFNTQTKLNIELNKRQTELTNLTDIMTPTL